MVIISTRFEEQSPPQLLPVKLNKEIFITDVCEKLHNLVKVLFNCFIT
uniref:GSVIVT00019763001, CUL1 n=1 Tax=Arundo donax TaxID=35708 RepID=A0A0A8YB51_ARUDO